MKIASLILILAVVLLSSCHHKEDINSILQESENFHPATAESYVECSGHRTGFYFVVFDNYTPENEKNTIIHMHDGLAPIMDIPFFNPKIYAIFGDANKVATTALTEDIKEDEIYLKITSGVRTFVAAPGQPVSVQVDGDKIIIEFDMYFDYFEDDVTEIWYDWFGFRGGMLNGVVKS